MEAGVAAPRDEPFDCGRLWLAHLSSGKSLFRKYAARWSDRCAATGGAAWYAFGIGAAVARDPELRTRALRAARRPPEEPLDLGVFPLLAWAARETGSRGPLDAAIAAAEGESTPAAVLVQAARLRPELFAPRALAGAGALAAAGTFTAAAALLKLSALDATAADGCLAAAEDIVAGAEAPTSPAESYFELECLCALAGSLPTSYL